MAKSYLIDMDGVIVRGSELIPGADAFLDRLRERGIKFLILTNNPVYTPRDLQHRLQRIGVSIAVEHIYTSALATAQFLKAQHPDGTAFVIGESGLTNALHDVGYVLTDHDPDYVVVGETTSLNYERLTQAVRWVSKGARFIATNPDPNGPGEGGLVPACGAITAFIETATGIQPYFVGKPNPLMMRTALRFLNEHSNTGVSTREMVEKFPYRPTRIVESVADLERE